MTSIFPRLWSRHLAQRRPTRGRRRSNSPSTERLESRALLAVSATVDGVELRIDLSDLHDAAALEVSVDAGVDLTVLGTRIQTAGAVAIHSASIAISADVHTSGFQSYAGLLRAGADVVLDAGGSEIRFGDQIRSITGPKDVRFLGVASPLQLALAPHGNTLYASDGPDVRVFNLITQAVESISVGGFLGQVVVAPDGSRLYAANSDDGAVTVIDTSSRQPVATIGVPGFLEGMALSSDGKTLFVASQGTVRPLEAGPDPHAILVIDTQTNQVTGSIPLAGSPTGIAPAADGRLWVTSTDLNEVVILSRATPWIVGRVDVGHRPRPIALTPDGQRAFVGNSGENTVSVIDTVSQTEIAVIGVGGGPASIQISADGRRAHVVNEFSNSVSIIDIATLTAVSTIATESGPVGLAISAMGETAFVANIDSVSELTYEARSLTVRTTGFVQFGGSLSSIDPLRSLVVDANREIESAGQVRLTIDRTGHLRANGTPIMIAGKPANYEGLILGGWTVVAADVDAGVNTLVLRHSSGNLHFFRLDAGWRQVSGDGWIAPGSATFYATELTFGADLDGNGRVTVEAAGDVTLTYVAGNHPDGHGNLLANGMPVMFNGQPANYKNMVAGGWTPMAAEADQGVNTVVLKHSSGNIHFWRMDADWRQASGDGWVVPGTSDFYASEVAFGVDLDGDGALTIETAGSVFFSYNRDGNIQANGQVVIYKGSPMNYHQMLAAGWRAMAADVHDGVNTVVLRHASGHVHFWLMDASWQQTGGRAWIPIGTRDFHAAEAAFGADLNGDGIRTIDAQGSIVLTYDRVGRLRVQQASAGAVAPTATFVIFNGLPANYHGARAAGWLVMAAEPHEDKNTILLKHSSGFLHFWRMDTTWRQVGGDGWIAPNSPNYLATEVHFGVDLNGDRRIGA